MWGPNGPSVEIVDQFVEQFERRGIEALDAQMIERIERCRTSAALLRGMSDYRDRIRAALQASHSLETATQAAWRFRLDWGTTGVLERCASSPKPAPPKAMGPLRLLYHHDREIEPIEDDYVPAGLLVAEFDLAWSAPKPIRFERGRPVVEDDSMLYVGEYRLAAHGHYRPPDQCRSLWASAIITAQFCRARHVKPVVMLFNDEWKFHYGKEVNLRVDEMKLRQLCAEVELQRQAIERGERPAHLVCGPHCANCPGGWTCPHHADYMRSVLLQSPPDSDALTEGEAEKLVDQLQDAETMVRRIRKTLKEYVREHGPVQMSDGRLWGPVERKVHLADDPTMAYEMLVEMVGKERARGALHLRRESAQRALRQACHAQRLQMTPDQAWLAFLGAIAERGGHRQYRFVKYGPHEEATTKPKAKETSSAPPTKRQPEERRPEDRQAPSPKDGQPKRRRRRKSTELDDDKPNDP